MDTEKPAESSQPEKLVRWSAADMLAYTKSPEARAHAERMHALGDEPTAKDLDEIPEITEEEWATARPMNQLLLLRVDSDIRDWFRQHQDYEARINCILRKVMEREQAQIESTR